MTDSSPVLPNSNSSNSSSSASSKKMTKSYLLESDPILKTSSKATSSPFALSNNNNNNAEGTGGNAGNGGSGGGGHRHHPHHHQQQRSSTNWSHYQEDAAAAAAASAAIQQQLRHQHLQLQQHSIPGHDLFSDRPSVKPSLAAHHVQPIAYINGNSVRPVRCRHYSQQQTALSVVHQQQRQEQQQQQAMQHSNGRNLNAKRGGRGIDSMSESTSSTNSTSSISGSSTTGSIDSDGAINHEELMIMDFDGLSNSSGGGGGGNGSGNEAGPAHPPVGHYGAGNAINSGGGNQRRVQFADGGRKMHSSSSSTTTNFSSGAVSSSSYSTASHSNTHSSSSSQQQQRNQSSSSSAGANQQPRSKSSWFSLFTSFSFSSPSSTSSPSSASASASSASSSSQRDSVTIDENELNVNALCYADQPELVIDHLAKVIEAQLRDARENRRLVCKELFLPNDLLRNIAAKVRLLAEPEPCGLRGCKFYICIEDKDASALNSGNTPPATTQSVVSGGGGGGHPYHRSNSQSPSPVNSRLLGEVSLDRTMVPTFEVFLTLKPTLPNWFDVLESRLFGRERIIVAENYLIHKKKLYRSHDESPTSDM